MIEIMSAVDRYTELAVVNVIISSILCIAFHDFFPSKKKELRVIDCLKLDRLKW